MYPFGSYKDLAPTEQAISPAVAHECVNIRRSRGARLACEAVVSKAKDRTD